MNLQTILKPHLAAYAQDLINHGFRVYLPTSELDRVARGGMESVANWFRYSRDVDGQTCYAIVQGDHFESVKLLMPIKPSRENGSDMFIGGKNDVDVADIATAEKYASPTGWNYLIGTQKNHDADHDRYQEVSA